MATHVTDSREFLIGLLREAKIVEEIVEDVADACEFASFSAFTLASKSITVAMLAEKLYLTRQEAESLKKVTVARLSGVDTGPESPFARQDICHPTNKNSKTVSIEVLASSYPKKHASYHKSMRSIESFLGRDGGNKALETSSYESEASCGHWTDCTTEHDSSGVSSERTSGRQPSQKIPMQRYTSDKTSKRSSTQRQKGTFSMLTNIQSTVPQKVKVRPFIPPLHLEDAGLSYGPPNSRPASYTSLGSLSATPLDLYMDLRSERRHHSENGDVCTDSDPPLRRREIYPPHRRLPSKIKTKKVKKIPSYMKSTVASEARNRELKEQRDLKEVTLFKGGSGQLNRSIAGSVKGTKPRPPSAQLMRPTKASIARDAEIKNRMASVSRPNSTVFGSVSSMAKWNRPQKSLTKPPKAGRPPK